MVKKICTFIVYLAPTLLHFRRDPSRGKLRWHADVDAIDTNADKSNTTGTEVLQDKT